MMPTIAMTPPPSRYAPQMLATPGVGGVFVGVNQSDLLPARGQPNDTTIKAQLAVIPPTMPIILAVKFGANIAPWMLTLPNGVAVKINVPDGYHMGRPTECDVAAPFTDAFVTAALETMRAAITALDGRPVAGVTLGHAGWYDTEAPNYALGYHGPADPSWKAGSAIWAAAGYRPSLGLAAFQKFVSGVADFLPDADYMLAPWDASAGLGLPWVDESGAVLDKPDRTGINPYLAWLGATFGDRAWAMFTSLTDTGVIPDLYAFAQRQGMRIGCQTVTGTSSAPWPQKAGQITAAATIAAAAGAGTLQFHPAALRAFPNEIAAAASIIGGAPVAVAS